MKKILFKRLMSLALSLVLLLSLLPAGVVAAEPQGTEVLLSWKTRELLPLELAGDHTSSENAVEIYEGAGYFSSWFKRLKLTSNTPLAYTRAYNNINGYLDRTMYGMEEDDKLWLLEGGNDLAIPILSYSGVANSKDGLQNVIAAKRNEVGYPSLEEAAKYAAAVFAAYDRDESPFWLGDKGLVGERVTYTEQENGMVDYTVTTYFYVVKKSHGDDFTLYNDHYPLGQGVQEDYITYIYELVLSFAQYVYHPEYEQLQIIYDWCREKYLATEPGTSDVSKEAISVVLGLTGEDAPQPEAYARAFHMINATNDCVLANGLDEDNNPHMWNLVKMEDEKWYAVDVAKGLFLVGSDNLPYTTTNVVTDGGTAFLNGPELSETDYDLGNDDRCVNHVWVNGIDLANSDNTVEGASYNSTTKTLTLTNATLGGEGKNHKGAGIYVTGHDAIVLELNGENNVTGIGFDADNSADECDVLAAVSTDAGLIIQGAGTLNAVVNASGMTAANYDRFAAVCSGEDMEIKSGTVNAKADISIGDGYGLLAGIGWMGDLTLSGGRVTANGNDSGIAATDSVRITGGQVTVGDITPPRYGIKIDGVLSGLLSDGGISVSGNAGVKIQSTSGAFGGERPAIALEGENYAWKDANGVLRNGGTPEPDTTWFVAPATLRLSLEKEDDLKISKVEEYHETAGVWTDVSKNAAYQWYAREEYPVEPSQDPNAKIAGEAYTPDTVSFEDGLWKLTGKDIAGIRISGTELQPGDQLVITPSSPRIIVIVGNNNSPTCYGGTYLYTLTERDMENGSETFLAALMYEGFVDDSASLKVSVRKNLPVTGENKNTFLPLQDGSYYAEVTLTEGDETLAKLRSEIVDFARHTVTFDPCGGTYGTENATWSILEPLDLEKAPTREGYIFQGWFDKAQGGNKITGDTEFTKDTTVYAQWKLKQYSIKWDTNGDGTADKTDTVNHGTKPTAPTASKPQVGCTKYTFTGWDKAVVAATKNTTYTATFTEGINHVGKTTVVGKKEATCKEAGYTGDTVCECGTTVKKGEAIPKLTAHTWGDWITTTKPTETVEGEKTRTCSVCGKPEKKPIPALGVSDDGACKQDSSCPTASFTDLEPTSWYHDGIHYCLEKGLMNGIGNAQFSPTGTTSRAMVVTILWRLAGEPGAENAPDFQDVKPGKWYTDAIAWAAENGIVQGYDNGSFGTDDPVTREQMAVFLYRFAKLQDNAVASDSYAGSFVDEDAVSSWAEEAMRWANKGGLITGKPGNRLAPQEQATRAETATILQRYSQF